MQGIRSVDSWAQFVNLVQDARIRNQTVSNVKSAPVVSQVKGTRRIMNQVATAAPERPSYAPAVAMSILTNTPKAATKALGSFFDAYA